MIAGGKLAPAPDLACSADALLARDTVAVRLASVMAASVTAAPVNSWTMRPRAKINTRSQMPSSSMSVGGRHQHRQALVGDRSQPLVDFAARADIDALGRLVHQEHRGLRRDLAPEQRLLLIAARQFVKLGFGRGGADAQIFGDLLGADGFAGAVDHANSREIARRKPRLKFSRSVRLRNTPSLWRSSVMKPMPDWRNAPGCRRKSCMPLTRTSPPCGGRCRRRRG